MKYWIHPNHWCKHQLDASREERGLGVDSDNPLLRRAISHRDARGDCERVKRGDDVRSRRCAATYVSCQQLPISDVCRHVIGLAGQTRLEPPFRFGVLLQPGQSLTQQIVHALRRKQTQFGIARDLVCRLDRSIGFVLSFSLWKIRSRSSALLLSGRD